MSRGLAKLLAIAMVGQAAFPGLYGASAGEVKAAVAANFAAPATEIGGAFGLATGHAVIFSFGSTGQLYAQISQAAPYDVFLAADRARPLKAVENGYAIPNTRFTYASGRLALYSRTPELTDIERRLHDLSLDRVAIANPVTAPYGAAAVQTMKALGVYGKLQRKLVQGINISQTYQFVASGNAPIGFVALSQIAGGTTGSHWIVPEELHDPIAQDAVLLLPGAANPAARDFMAFLRSAAARGIMGGYGYGAGE